MLPAPVEITHRPRVGGGFDEDGYRVDPGYAPPVVRRVVAAYWEQPQAVVAADSPDRVLDELVVLTTEPEAFAHGDRIEVSGELYEVVGPRDWGLGPFGFKPGGEVRARRAQG